ncbi:MAG: serine hydrolase [Clostridia bacterium]|nr:serine hydrolase [Clostridia bacterium]
MLFDKITPEEAGIESRYVADYISVLERHGMTTHSLLMMRGDKLFAEYYWAPFHRDFLHRMYSQTKSYVSIAIGLLIDEGKVELDAPIISYFPDKIRREIPEYLKRQTVRDMLMMETSVRPPHWFSTENPDRTDEYINDSNIIRPSGTIWEYDSAGSQVLSSLVERLSGMKLMDYLRLKVFDKIGTFRTARVLETPNGDSWGDSALLCTSRDMASGGRFVMNYGRWNGEQLLSEQYLRDATSALVDNDTEGFEGCFRHGYGYQIWKTERDGFAFVGMGDQITVCVPNKDFIFVITSDNQFLAQAREVIVDAMFDIIVENLKDAPVAVDAAQVKRLADMTADLKLRTVKGKKYVPFADRINGKTFTVKGANKTGIKKFSFELSEEGECHFNYTNAQGEKVLKFGMCRNEFGKFPEFGYSDQRGGTVSDGGFTYNCAVSGAWREEQKLMLRVWIIDNYFGNMTAVFSFKGDEVWVRMLGNAENFLKEYNGEFLAVMEE